MAKNSKSDFFSSLAFYEKEGRISPNVARGIEGFYTSYLGTVAPIREELGDLEAFFVGFLERVVEQEEHPYEFEHYHTKLRGPPYDYHKFSMDFVRPLVDKQKSSLAGTEHLEGILQHLDEGHNVVFLANHQTEADPMAISVLLEEKFPRLAREMIFVAGERVVTDPLAVPFSLGCNLLCIYSKRYIDQPPELQHEKQLHNKKTMRVMSSLLTEGGKCIYVAPSGGRDRKSASGEIEIAPFDPKSIEMFYFMAKRSKTPTFFYPMALNTYELLPPPETVQIELGEQRAAKRVGIHLSIGAPIDMDHFPGSDHADKEYRRKSRSEYIWDLVKNDYLKFPKEK